MPHIEFCGIALSEPGKPVSNTNSDQFRTPSNLSQANDAFVMAPRLTPTDFDREFRLRMEPFTLTADFLKENKSVFESPLSAPRTRDRHILWWSRVRNNLIDSECVDNKCKLIVGDNYDTVVETLKKTSRCELIRITLTNIKAAKHHKAPWVFPTEKEMRILFKGAYRALLAGLRIESTGVMRVILPLIELLHRVSKMRALFNQTDAWTEDPVRFMQQLCTPNDQIDRSRRCKSCRVAVPATTQSAVITVDEVSITAYLATFTGIMDDFTDYCDRCNKHTVHHWTPRITIPGGQGLLVKPQPKYRLRGEDIKISIPSYKWFWVLKAGICGPGRAFWVDGDDLWRFLYDTYGRQGLPCTLAFKTDESYDWLDGYEMALLYYERIADPDGDDGCDDDGCDDDGCDDDGIAEPDGDDGSDDDGSDDDGSDDGAAVGHGNETAGKDLVHKINLIDLSNVDSVLTVEVMGSRSKIFLFEVLVGCSIFAGPKPEEHLLDTLHTTAAKKQYYELVSFKLTGMKQDTLVDKFSLARGAVNRQHWDSICVTLEEYCSDRCTGILDGKPQRPFTV
ncbi:hypothetical protein FN846DRAFT_892247 [Sphaerosporella brunnea]|uniref:Uncharacterized protein n=1 Tax=Sphaerosporella brunnea TaxID=1250544 RepID=A0A5J5EQQ3_9PEZI|nr:hypothetical protein FN846DRAFT_892247 [Sphaerosporella brunnea]